MNTYIDIDIDSIFVDSNIRDSYDIADFNKLLDWIDERIRHEN